MSGGGFWEAAARRARAVARLEKAAGGRDEANWAIECVGQYYAAGGTADGLLLLLGPSERIHQQVAPEPQPQAPGESLSLLDAFTYQHEVYTESARLFQLPLTEDPGVVVDDLEEVALHFDRQLPTYLLRISTVAVATPPGFRAPVVRALVVEKADLL